MLTRSNIGIPPPLKALITSLKIDQIPDPIYQIQANSIHADADDDGTEGGTRPQVSHAATPNLEGPDLHLNPAFDTAIPREY